MKNLSIFLFGTILLLSFSISNGQIILNSDGNIGIGCSPSTNYDVTISEKINIDSNGNIGLGGSPNSGYNVAMSNTIFSNNVYFTNYYSGLKIDDSGFYSKALYPSQNNMNSLGKSNKAFNTVYSYHYPILSDARRKENIKPLSNSLSLLLKVQGVSYDLKREFVINDSLDMNEAMVNKLDEERKNNIGFLAQDVNEIFPELVFYDDSTDIYMIEYNRFIPILVEALKEQQDLIESMQSEMLELKNGNLKSLTLSGSEDSQIQNKCVLYQNAPNPFSISTTIRYNLPESTTDANIMICDMNGKQIRSVPLNSFGEASIEIAGGEFSPGMYMYAMIIDNQLVDTKQMVITE